MSTVHQASMTSFGGNTFWGLVQQKGPWKSTPSDEKRATQSKPNYGGGGTGAGGTAHAGNGNWSQIMTPNQLNGSAAPLKPSAYAMRSVMMSPVDMKKQTKMGRVKSKLTLGSRAPFQTGQKMAKIPEEIRFDQPGEIKGDVPMYTEGPFITDIQMKPEPTFIPPRPDPDQVRASEIARDDERIAVMNGMEDDELMQRWLNLRSETERTKRRGSFQLGPEMPKRQEKGFGEVGFKRKEHEGERGQTKKPRTLFQGPLKSEEPSATSIKRKAETQIMSEKFKKMDTKKVVRKPKLKIQTENIGKRFMEKKAESKSRPKKFDQLPEVRTRRTTRPLRPEQKFGSLGTREAQDFYTTEYPSRAGAKRKSKAPLKNRDKRSK